MPYISLHGRAFGFDSDTGAIVRNGVEGGAGDATVTSATVSSTGTAIVPRGVTTIVSSSAKTHTLTAPIAGVPKVLTATTTTTAARSVTLASGNFATTTASTFVTATFTGLGQTLSLQALSTALFQVVGNIGPVTFA